MNKHMPKMTSTCNGIGCGETIHWGPGANGKLHPYNNADHKISHFSTCPDAARFKLAKTAQQKLTFNIEHGKGAS